MLYMQQSAGIWDKRVVLGNSEWNKHLYKDQSRDCILLPFTLRRSLNMNKSKLHFDQKDVQNLFCVFIIKIF